MEFRKRCMGTQQRTDECCGISGGDDPGRDSSSILAKFDLFSDSLKKNAKELLPHAVRDKTPPQRPGQGYGGGGEGPSDPD
eukprot:1133448-Amphidinium_carterae.1